ncbi:MAG: Gfo/Idh/MocA family oxidoreductase [Clostridia bacterium]|nr:Gfo/Idh/MocA family oxidoreductase [Clostridia bacterium]
MIKFGLIGFGGIARSHKAAHLKLENEGFGSKLVAICDIRPEIFGKDMEINLGAANTGSMDGINLYTSVDEMLEKEELDAVDICLPSYMHADMAVKCLEKGLHVMSEKPMALNTKDCKRMIAAANKADRKLMIGLCLRFEPMYLVLKEMIDSNKFGKVNNVYFERLGGMPTGWENWYYDPEKSGGIEFDLHIHDLDMTRFLFGEPKWVSSVKNGYRNINTRFGYDGFSVMTVDDWSGSNTFKFKMGYRVAFDDATVVMENGIVTVFPYEGETYTVEYSKADRMAEELRYLCQQITDGIENTTNSLESTMADIALTEKVRKSYEHNGKVIKL